MNVFTRLQKNIVATFWQYVVCCKLHLVPTAILQLFHGMPYRNSYRTSQWLRFLPSTSQPNVSQQQEKTGVCNLMHVTCVWMQSLRCWVRMLLIILYYLYKDKFVCYCVVFKSHGLPRNKQILWRATSLVAILTLLVST